MRQASFASWVLWLIACGHVVVLSLLVLLRMSDIYLPDEMWSLAERLGPISGVSVAMLVKVAMRQAATAQDQHDTMPLSVAILIILLLVFLQGGLFFVVLRAKQAFSSMDEVTKLVAAMETVIGLYVGAVVDELGSHRKKS